MSDSSLVLRVLGLRMSTTVSSFMWGLGFELRSSQLPDKPFACPDPHLLLLFLFYSISGAFLFVLFVLEILSKNQT